MSGKQIRRFGDCSLTSPQAECMSEMSGIRPSRVEPITSPALPQTVGFLALLVLIWLSDYLLTLHLSQFGIFPRTLRGLIGIATAPLIHGSFGHVLSNVTSLFLLLFFLFGDRRYHPRSTLALIWVLGGLGTWLIGRESSHIGASSLIFGLVPYIILAAFWMKCRYAMLIALVVLFFNIGVFYALIRVQEGVSWEGHLSGFIAGIMTAYILHKK